MARTELKNRIFGETALGRGLRATLGVAGACALFSFLGSIDTNNANNNNSNKAQARISTIYYSPSVTDNPSATETNTPTAVFTETPADTETPPQPVTATPNSTIDALGTSVNLTQNAPTLTLFPSPTLTATPENGNKRLEQFNDFRKGNTDEQALIKVLDQANKYPDKSNLLAISIETKPGSNFGHPSIYPDQNFQLGESIETQSETVNEIINQDMDKPINELFTVDAESGNITCEIIGKNLQAAADFSALCILAVQNPNLATITPSEAFRDPKIISQIQEVKSRMIFSPSLSFTGNTRTQPVVDNISDQIPSVLIDGPDTFTTCEQMRNIATGNTITQEFVIHGSGPIVDAENTANVANEGYSILITAIRTANGIKFAIVIVTDRAFPDKSDSSDLSTREANDWASGNILRNCGPSITKPTNTPQIGVTFQPTPPPQHIVPTKESTQYPTPAPTNPGRTSIPSATAGIPETPTPVVTATRPSH